MHMHIRLAGYPGILNPGTRVPRVPVPGYPVSDMHTRVPVPGYPYNVEECTEKG